MKKIILIAASSFAVAAFGPLAPTTFAQAAPSAEIQAIGQQLKLTPQQKMKLFPILKEGGPKLEAINNNKSLSGMQKMQQLCAIHAHSDPQVKAILSPTQYSQLQAIRQQKIRAGHAAEAGGGREVVGLRVSLSFSRHTETRWFTSRKRRDEMVGQMHGDA